MAIPLVGRRHRPYENHDKQTRGYRRKIGQLPASGDDGVAAWPAPWEEKALLQFVAALLSLYGPADQDARRGQSLVEYALIIVLIAIAVIAAMTALQGGISGVFDKIRSSLGG
jgi:pilus assembly protein Flp/PilA